MEPGGKAARFDATTFLARLWVGGEPVHFGSIIEALKHYFFGGKWSGEYKELLGVPLTGYWLERLGFKKGEDCDYILDGFKLWSYGEDKAGYYHINSEIILYFDCVHNIQNAWMVLVEKDF